MKIAIIGLGYVGIQLAVGLGRQHMVVGFDLNDTKVRAYRSGEDPTGEVSEEQLQRAASLSSDLLGGCRAGHHAGYPSPSAYVGQFRRGCRPCWSRGGLTERA